MPIITERKKLPIHLPDCYGNGCDRGALGGVTKASEPVLLLLALAASAEWSFIQTNLRAHLREKHTSSAGGDVLSAKLQQQATAIVYFAKEHKSPRYRRRISAMQYRGRVYPVARFDRASACSRHAPRQARRGLTVLGCSRLFNVSPPLPLLIPLPLLTVKYGSLLIYHGCGDVN